MGLYLVNGLAFTQHIEMPDGGRIIVADWGKQPEWSGHTQLHFWNHSLFRLDKSGGVVWQVKRDEGDELQWASSREKAESDNVGSVWTRSPFMNLVLKYADGSTNMDRATGKGPGVATWVDGASVYCHTLDQKSYTVDIDTGVAKLVFMPGRPW
jgi:hypothetical protein